MKLCDLTFKAFSSRLPNKVIAATKGINCHMACGGQDPRNGDYYTFLETVCGGYGGRAYEGWNGRRAESHTEYGELSNRRDRKQIILL